jgi:heme-degrading monooxygenase HmoA
LRPDTREAALRDALAGLDAFLATQSGFIRRRSLRDGDQYADLVEWRDRASADAGARAVMQSAAAARYFALLDLAGARMRHFEVIA